MSFFHLGDLKGTVLLKNIILPQSKEGCDLDYLYEESQMGVNDRRNSCHYEMFQKTAQNFNPDMKPRMS